MIRRIAIAAFMLIMAPAFAFAGTFSIAVSGSGGSIGPTPLSGYASAAKVFTATATTGYTLSSVTDNSVNVTTNSSYVTGSGPWTVTIPLSSSSQTFYVSFKQNVQVAPTLSAVLPAAITVPGRHPDRSKRRQQHHCQPADRHPGHVYIRRHRTDLLPGFRPGYQSDQHHH